jgi:hypothetical protein
LKEYQQEVLVRLRISKNNNKRGNKMKKEVAWKTGEIPRKCK